MNTRRMKLHRVPVQKSRLSAVFPSPPLTYLSTVDSRSNVPPWQPQVPSSPPCTPMSTPDPPVVAIDIPLADLVLRKDLQPRGKPGRGKLSATRGAQVAQGKLSPAAVTRYATKLRNEGPESLPPILVARYRGRLYVVDGFHRVEAYRAEGFTTIPAIVRAMTLKDARWEAIACNSTHGLPLSPTIRKEAFRRYMQARQYIAADGTIKSYRDMAIDFNGFISKSGVHKYMDQLYPEIAAQIAEDHHGLTEGAPKGGLQDWPATRTPHEALVQGVRDAVTEALADDPADHTLRRTIASALRHLAAELENANAV